MACKFLVRGRMDTAIQREKSACTRNGGDFNFKRALDNAQRMVSKEMQEARGTKKKWIGIFENAAKLALKYGDEKLAAKYYKMVAEKCIELVRGTFYENDTMVRRWVGLWYLRKANSALAKSREIDATYGCESKDDETVHAEIHTVNQMFGEIRELTEQLNAIEYRERFTVKATSALLAGIIGVMTLLPFARIVSAEENGTDSCPTFSLHCSDPTTIILFTRQAWKTHQTSYGFSVGGSNELGPFSTTLRLGLLFQNGSATFDQLVAAASYSIPIVPNSPISVTSTVYGYRDLQVGVSRGEGVEVRVGTSNMGVMVFAEHLEENVYPLGAGVDGKLGPVSVRVHGVAPIDSQSGKVGAGFRAIVSVKIADGVHLDANHFVMTVPDASGYRGVVNSTTQGGVTATF